MGYSPSLSHRILETLKYELVDSCKTHLKNGNEYLSKWFQCSNTAKTILKIGTVFQKYGLR